MANPQCVMRDWLVRLDGRIDRCPGCDEWRWDQRCGKCNTRLAEEVSDGEDQEH